MEELDFEHFPVKNGFPGIPVKAWIRFLNCAELVDGEVCVTLSMGPLNP